MRVFFIAILMVVWFSGCQNDDQGAGQNAAGDSSSSTTALKATPPPNTREAQILLRNYWVFEFYIVPGDRETSMANRGRWYKFNADGTFLTGQWEEDWSQGIWSIYYGGEFPVIHVDAERNDIDGEWELQGISGDEETLSWMGTRRYNHKGTAVKVINLLTKPTKKQFNME